VSQPLLPGQIGYTTKYALASEPAAAAKKALEQAGVGKTPQFTLVTLDNDELKDAAAEIKRQYAAIGVTVKVNLVSLDSLQQSYMRPRNFQMLLFGINVGADPDVYTYWHSSQAKDPGVNLSGYSSDAADVALEAGRIKADSDIRRAKYDAFLKAWDDDAPAVVLYQSIYRYAVRDTVSGPQPGRLGVASDRFWRVERWTVLRRPVPVGFK
jgi:peptide/nickel transport system substrate-binding protein